MLSGGKYFVAAYRHTSNERNCTYSNNRRCNIRTPKRTPTANTYIKAYEPAMLTDVTSSLPQGPSRNATKKLRSLEQRATPQLQEKHSYSEHTRSICYQVPIIIVTVYHRIARPSNCALSNDEQHAATSASPMTVTHPPIYKSGKLSNVASPLSHCPVTERDQATVPSQSTSNTTTARTLPQYIFRIKSRCRRTQCSLMSRHHCHSTRRGPRPSNCALSHDKWHAATLTSPMTLFIQL